MTNAITLVETARPQFLAALGGESPESVALFNKEAGFAVQVLSSSEYAMKIARANPQSAVNAVINIAAIGISLNPAKKQAYLVPRDNKICLDIGYMGFIDLATESGAIRWAQPDIVCEGEKFVLTGVDKAPIHEFDPFSRNLDKIRGAYVVVKTADGDFLTHTMSIGEVYDIRARSSAWRAFKKNGTSCPWATDEVQMILKTCIKQANKTWPRDKTNDRLGRAINYTNENGEGFEVLANDEPADAGEDLMPTRAVKPTEATDVTPKTTAAATTPAPAPAPVQADSGALATEGEIAHIRLKAGDKLPQLLAKAGLASLDGLTKPAFAKCRQILKEL